MNALLRGATAVLASASLVLWAPSAAAQGC